MVEEEISQSLDAIHDEALKLAMRDDLPEEIQDGLNLILLLSRHNQDMHSEREAGRRPQVNEPEEDLDIIEHLSAGNGLRLIPHPAEGHVRSDPEMKALLEDIDRHYRVLHERLKNDTPDAA